ncbi:MAG: hypothetical protein IKE56_04575 [Lachnospiraceae bacterium]|nr:hypothetical protein [Lachnospiraceae bacterium]
MGYGFHFRCGKCNYSFNASLDVGMLFPLTYEETVKAGREGKLGDDIRDFLEKHPDGALDVSGAAYKCSKCGNLASDKVLTMYLPKAPEARQEKEKGCWSVGFTGDGIDYVAPWELKTDHKFYRIHPHYCKECGSRMRKLSEKELKAGLWCPHCGERMEQGGYDWD